MADELASVAPKQPPTRPGVIGRLNPTTCLLVAVILSLPLVVTLDWLSATVALVLELVVLLCCGIAWAPLLRRLAPLTVLALLGATSMALYGQASGRTWWHWGPARISDGSLALAEALFIRFFALVLPAMALWNGIDATRLADGLSQVLHLPARFVLGTLAGFRMFGLFTEDWRTLGQARRARGLGDVGRLRRLVTMSFALLVLAVRRGSRLATAMEAKGFGTDIPRTWARPSRMGRLDAVALVVAVLVGAAALAAAALGGTLRGVWS